MLAWYEEMRRDLPWRRTREPYAILVSEIMLQQTRVETVLGRYESFLARFPTIADLAAAPLDDVLAEWSGLGYYRRPRGLHALARVVVDEHGGEIPDSLEELLALPGLGPYSAAAIGSIAFGIPALSVDGNVGRVLCRIAALEDDPKRAPVRRKLEGMVAVAMSEHPPGEINQAIMELGARVCAPRSPGCHDCPCAPYCEAHSLGIEELIPPSSKEVVHAVVECAAVIEREGRYLLFRGQRPSLVADMWEFPTLDSRLTTRPSKAALGRHLADIGYRVELGSKLGEIRHGMTNRRISCRVYEGRAESDEIERDANRLDHVVADSSDGAAAVGVPMPAETGWFTPREAAHLPLAASTQKTLALINCT
jgi:A/G-specific adenine glycosylase